MMSFWSTVTPMSEADDTPGKRPRGRPATGITEKRQVRIGDTWDRAEALALELARSQGKVRKVKNRETGETEEKGDIAGYVEEALQRHNAHIERQLARQGRAE
jgi:hypothetical protein